MWILLTVSAILLIVIILVSYSRLYYHRSTMATLSEWYLKLTEKRYTNEQLLKEIEQAKTATKAEKEKAEKNFRSLLVKSIDYKGMEVFYVNTLSACRTAVIYLHGGAYFRPPRKWHYRFVKMVCKDSNTPFIMPIYPKIPQGDCVSTYELLRDFYINTRKHYDKIVLMGDSSGGGLALGFAQFLNSEGITQPNKLILLSPWVDIAMLNPNIGEYEKCDPIISVDNCKLLGKTWANGLELDDYRVSPIFGNMQGLCETYLFCGTRELLLPDCELLDQLLKDAEVESHYFEGENLNHVYPVYPTKEGKKARRIIAGLIEEVKYTVIRKEMTTEERDRIIETVKRNAGIIK